MLLGLDGGIDIPQWAQSVVKSKTCTPCTDEVMETSAYGVKESGKERDDVEKEEEGKKKKKGKGGGCKVRSRRRTKAISTGRQMCQPRTSRVRVGGAGQGGEGRDTAWLGGRSDVLAKLVKGQCLAVVPCLVPLVGRCLITKR